MGPVPLVYVGHRTGPIYEFFKGPSLSVAEKVLFLLFFEAFENW